MMPIRLAALGGKDEIVIGEDLLVAVGHTISGDFAQDAFAGLRG
ncbi:hypothetical protein [Leucobacter ruminantium]|nr:hypothetical protein [Leucobacter ruminantium]